MSVTGARRDAWLSRTTRAGGVVAGFIAVFVVLTLLGTAFRGQGMELLWPWEVKPPVS